MSAKKKGFPRKAAGGVPVFCAHKAIVRADALKPNPVNPNRHPPAQLRLLGKILRAHGWRNPIVVSKRSQLVVKGHGRLEAAKKEGLKWVPVDYQEYRSDAEEKADLLADNRLAELAETDDDALKALIKDLESSGSDLELAGFDEKAIDRLIDQMVAGDERTEANADELVQLQKQWGTERGQSWRIPSRETPGASHAIRCGDSTDIDDVLALLRGEPPLLMVTDPPYGVSYDPSWREGADLGVGKRSTGKVENDDRVDWGAAFALFAPQVAYVWHAPTYGSVVAASLQKCEMEIIAQIVWVKQHFVLSRGNYHWKHEGCLYAVRAGATHNWQGARDQTSVWEISNNNSFGNQEKEKTFGHGTQKPLECMRRPLLNNLARGGGLCRSVPRIRKHAHRRRVLRPSLHRHGNRSAVCCGLSPARQGAGARAGS